MSKGIKEQLDDVLQQMNKIYQRTEEQHLEMKAELAVSHKELGALHNKFDTLDKKVDTLDKKVDTLDKKVDTLDKKVDTLDEKVDTLDEKVGELQKAINNELDDNNPYVRGVKRYFKEMCKAKLQSKKINVDADHSYKYKLLSIDAPSPMIGANTHAYSHAVEGNDSLPHRETASKPSSASSGPRSRSSEKPPAKPKAEASASAAAATKSEGKTSRASRNCARRPATHSRQRRKTVKSSASSASSSPSSRSSENPADKPKASASAAAATDEVKVSSAPHNHTHSRSAGADPPPPLDKGTKILVRPCYDTALEKIRQAHTHDSSRRVLVAGAPGIGKSVAFGAGYILYSLIQDALHQRSVMKFATDILWTSSKGVSLVFHVGPEFVEGYRKDPENFNVNVDVYTSYAGIVPTLACAATTVWIMDNKEHGPFDSAQGLVILLSSGKPKNYEEFSKCRHLTLTWLPAWDGKLRYRGLPAELYALYFECFAIYKDDKELENVVRKFNILGPFPRGVFTQSLLTAKRLQKQSQHDISGGNWLDFLGTGSINLSQDSPSMRLLYPRVNRDTLQTEYLVAASPDIEWEMLRLQAKRGYGALVENIIFQSKLSGHLNWNLGKVYEELTILYVDTVNRLIKCRELVAGGNNSKSFTDLRLPGKRRNPKDDFEPRLQRVNSYRTQPAEIPCFYYSASKGEPVVDAYFVVLETDDEGIERVIVYLIQITLNSSHAIVLEKLKTLIGFILDALPPGIDILFKYVFLTNQIRAARFNKVNLDAKSDKVNIAPKKSKVKSRRKKSNRSKPTSERQKKKKAAVRKKATILKHVKAMKQYAGYLPDFDVEKFINVTNSSRSHLRENQDLADANRLSLPPLFEVSTVHDS